MCQILIHAKKKMKLKLCCFLKSFQEMEALKKEMSHLYHTQMFNKCFLTEGEKAVLSVSLVYNKSLDDGNKYLI